MKRLKAVLGNPFVVMSLVIGMYAIKAAVKISVGEAVNSPVIAGDGFHNLADILEAVAVMAVVWVAKRKPTQSYPFGRKNIEFFTGVAIGLALMVMAGRFALQSIGGLLAMAPGLDEGLRGWLWLPTHEPLVMNADVMPLVLAVTGLSVVASWAVSRYQIAVGKAAGHASLVADGEETYNDGRIELVAFVGIICEYVFAMPWIEYPLGLVVAFLVARTGFLLARSACRVLLQHSLGDEHEAGIAKTINSFPGVENVGSLKTFQVGQTAVVLVTVGTWRNASACQHIKYGIEHALTQYLSDAGFKGCDLHVKFAKSLPNRRRVAYAMRLKDGVSAVAGVIAEATHLVVCDVERGAIVRARKDMVPSDVDRFVKDKRIDVLYVFDKEKQPPLLSPDSPCRIEQSVAYHPAVIGIEKVTG